MHVWKCVVLLILLDINPFITGDGSAPGWKDQGHPEEGMVEKETGTGAKEKDQKKQQACGHCACACQADDVWQAYGVSVTVYVVL